VSARLTAGEDDEEQRTAASQQETSRSERERRPIVFVIIALVAVYAVLLLVAGRLGAGSVDSFVNLFDSPRTPPRPYGTQENDLAPFAFR
jgi:hypothetical protein